MATRAPHPRVAEQTVWQERLDQAIAELRLAALHKTLALDAIKQALAEGATWSEVSAFLRDRRVRVPRQR